MSYPVYTVYSGDVLPIFFDSFDGGTGASLTLTGLAVTDIEIYKDGGTTQRASDAGYTLLDTDGIDFDGVTGIHGFSIDTGDNTDAGFYAVGSWYHVVVSSVTIDSQTVNFVAAAFRIVAAEAVAGVPVVDVKAISGDSTAADNLETACDGGAYNVGGGAVVAASVTTKTDYALTSAYDAAKSAAPAGAKMDIVDAPNATGLAAIADAFLKRDWTSVTGEATRSVLNALRPLLNKWTSASGAGGYVVKKEDDSTTAWTGTLTVDENGNISGMDHD